jgi:hypothetical protein
MRGVGKLITAIKGYWNAGGCLGKGRRHELTDARFRFWSIWISKYLGADATSDQ